ncbi:MAG: hypothetical protein MZW92_77345 [Comamonadaceae bacterium]|nr:hypothetical protein [Comamonadaceae bacterium]
MLRIIIAQPQRHPFRRHARASSTGCRAQDADVVCLQELKAQAGDLDDTMLRSRAAATPPSTAPRKRATAASAIYSRRKPDRR